MVEPIRLRYEPSPYHKLNADFHGPPANRPDARKCPEAVSRAIAEAWLNEGFAMKLFDTMAGKFPKQIYYANEGQFYVARITNEAQGIYHGHPGGSDDIPISIRKQMRDAGLISPKEYGQSL